MDPSQNVTTLQTFTNSVDLTDHECIIRQSDENSRNLFHFIIYGILLNIVGIMGLIGNGLSIAILSRTNMRSSINCCLVGLASFDSILLLTSLLMFGISSIPEYTGLMIWYQRDVFPWITLGAYPLGIISQTGSVYLTVTVTVERYVAVCHPLKAKAMCTYGRARMYVILVAVFSVLYNLPRFWEITYKSCSYGEEVFTTVVMTEMRESQSYIQIYITWLYLLVMYLIPFLSLLVLNVYIYKQVRLANHERQRLSRLQKKELSLAVMLLCVVIVFFLCNILAFIVNVLEMFGITLDYLTMINNLLVTVNSSVNFVIYCIFGQKFRRIFMHIFCMGTINGYNVPEGPYGESRFGNNSVCRRTHFQNNPRQATATQTIRLTSWSTLQSRRLNRPATWQDARFNFNEEVNVPDSIDPSLEPLNQKNNGTSF